MCAYLGYYLMTFFSECRDISRLNWVKNSRFYFRFTMRDQDQENYNGQILINYGQGEPTM